MISSRRGPRIRRDIDGSPGPISSSADSLVPLSWPLPILRRSRSAALLSYATSLMWARRRLNRVARGMEWYAVPLSGCPRPGFGEDIAAGHPARQGPGDRQRCHFWIESGAPFRLGAAVAASRCGRFSPRSLSRYLLDPREPWPGRNTGATRIRLYATEVAFPITETAELVSEGDVQREAHFGFRDLA
jgi:hypothetical protein